MHLPNHSEGNSTTIIDIKSVKEEITMDSNDYEVLRRFSDYDNTSNTDDNIFEDMSDNQLMTYGQLEVSTKDMDDLTTLNDLIDFTCTKCRRTTKNPDYILNKTDLQCSHCQATMKFQCPRCKLLFRQFDSACRHARQICQINVNSVQEEKSEEFKYMRNCSECIFTTRSTVELRRHYRREHPTAITTETLNVCWRCGKRYKSRESMLNHARLCGRAPHIRCQFCTYKTKRREHLRVHMQHKHPDPESCHGGSYDCPNCKKKYKYLTSMKSHVMHCTWNEQPSTSTGMI